MSEVPKIAAGIAAMAQRAFRNKSEVDALEDVHRRFALRARRADLRERLATTKSFIALLRELRQSAA